MAKKPVLLCIMDGFGWVPGETYGNAVVAAKTPHLDALMAKYPMTTIEASGMAVGLPDGQMGNSEVGHTNMGAGRIVYQQLTLITKSIKDGEMLKNPVLVKNMQAAIDAGKAIHLMGLVGTGGVHSHADHWFGVLEMAKHMGAKDVYLHCITDGRDTDPHDGKRFLADLQAKLDELGIGKIASVSGRYYAMDRDNNWDREEKAYAAFVYGEGNHAANAAEAIEASYAADKTDEFVLPCVTCEGGRVQDGDTVIFMNFRPDRARQMTRIFCDDDFKGFERRGGRKQVTDAMRAYLRGSGATLIEQDAAAFRAYEGKGPVWSLFAQGNMSYALDRNDAEQPSLAEMTAKALEVLDRHKNGFFLMVEGSRIDMAAHAKDPVGVITEMLAFDKAVGVALDFARRDGRTAVVIMPDHGTSGLSFGDGAYKDYASKGLDSAYMNISKVRRTASGLEKILLKARPEQIRPLFREYTGIELTDDELALLRSSRNYTEADYMKVANSVNMVSSIARIVTSRTHFGFLSGSHTAEDVFLAAYHPEGDLPVGRNTNTEVHAYMADLLGLERPLAELTGELFAPHTEVFRGAKCSISAAEGQMPCLTVRKGRRTLRVPAYGSVAYLDGKPLKLRSAVVYIDRNDTFYLPRELGEKF